MFNNKLKGFGYTRDERKKIMYHLNHLHYKELHKKKWCHCHLSEDGILCPICYLNQLYHENEANINKWWEQGYKHRSWQHIKNHGGHKKYIKTESCI